MLTTRTQNKRDEHVQSLCILLIPTPQKYKISLDEVLQLPLPRVCVVEDPVENVKYLFQPVRREFNQLLPFEGLLQQGDMFAQWTSVDAEKTHRRTETLTDLTALNSGLPQ